MATKLAWNSPMRLRADRILGVTAATFAAATASGLVGTTENVDADIIDSGPINIVIPDDINGVYVNLVDGSNGATPPAGWDINPYTTTLGGSFNLWAIDTTTWFFTGTNQYVQPLGTLIDAAGTYGRPGAGTDVGLQVTFNAANYFGVVFPNEDTAADNFGWIEITFGATVGERAITRYAYEDAGTGIDIGAGAIPEPTSVSLLAMGAVGLMTRRRRRSV